MTLATSCVTTAPCFVSPYAGIHPQRPFHPPRRKETVGQIRRETACSPNRSKIKRENEEQKKKKRWHFYPPDFSLFPRCEHDGGGDGGKGDRDRRESRGSEKEREKDVWTCTCTERSQTEREREGFSSLSRDGKRR